jgi:hypothetical protein
MSDDIFLINTAKAKSEVETLITSLDRITTSLDALNKKTSLKKLEDELQKINSLDLRSPQRSMQDASDRIRKAVSEVVAEYGKLRETLGERGPVAKAWQAQWDAMRGKVKQALTGINSDVVAFNASLGAAMERAHRIQMDAD